MKEIVIKEKKGKLIEIIILDTIMVCACIFVLLIGITELNIIYLIAGVIGTMFFGGIYIYIIKGAVNSRPLLLISEDGITDTSTATSVGFIHWNEIEDINVKRVLAQKFIAIKVKNEDKVIERVSLIKQLAIKLNLLFKLPPISIALNTGDKSFDEVLTLLKEKLEEHKRAEVL